MPRALTEYRRKRHFDRTAEPAGKPHARGRSQWRFVIQKHAARRLHYDFRLECDGVLKSWAVPQGPCLDPSQKRLAVQVEDHPLEYGGFEGTIPAGEYGGGTVLLWDRGTWEADKDPRRGLESGRLKFRLHGQKLHGAWVLARMRPRPGEKKENWLLIKSRDEAARPLSETDVLEDEPASVASGRTISEVAAQSDRTWSSKTGESTKTTKTRTGKRRARPAKKRDRQFPSAARKAAFPDAVEPELATLVDEAPRGEEWLHEIKFDGYRLLAYLNKGRAVLRTRKQNDWTRRFPEIAEAVATLPANQAVLDGEVVAQTAEGISNFQALQTALSENRTAPLIYYAFDLLYLDGFDLREAGLIERKELLAELLKGAGGRVRYSEHFAGSGGDVFAKSCEMKLEGIVSKRRNEHYAGGRGKGWLKTKCVHREEFVIGGFTDSTASRRGLGALLVGYFDPSGKLIYAGKVGTGFSARSEEDVRERLKAREQPEKTFAGAVEDERKRTTHWVRPELVAQVEYSNWTEGGHLRHPSFQGLREDKPAREVRLERPAPTTASGGKKRSASQPKKRPASGAAEGSAAAAQNGASAGAAGFDFTPAQRRALASVHLTHPDKVLYPEDGLTKLDLVAYYMQVSEWMLPHVVNRPLTLVRCPEGSGGTCFYQKHAAAGTPEALERVMIQEKNTPEPYVAIQDLAGLLSIVQMGVLEIHTWGSTLVDLEKPDRLIFDLDPDPTVPWPAVVDAANEIRDRLERLGLTSFPKASGGKGLHLVLPLVRRQVWAEVKKFARTIAEQLARDTPGKYTSNMSKAARHGRIYVDYLRNDRGSTSIAAYSTRKRGGAPVATPLAWNEVSAEIRADHFDVRNVPARLAALKADPWAELPRIRQSLSANIWRRLSRSSDSPRA